MSNKSKIVFKFGIIIIILMTLIIMIGCAGKTDKDGNLIQSKMVGKFKSLEIYSVKTIDGTIIYIGVDTNNRPVTNVTYQASNGKTRTPRSFIYVNDIGDTIDVKEKK